MDQAQDTTPDFGQKADDRPHGFSQPWLDRFNKNPYVLPSDLVVAGDDSPLGQRLSGTFLDDGRAKLPWSREHEALLQNMLAAPARLRLHDFRVGPDGERVPVVGADGKQAVDGAGQPQWERETKEIATFHKLTVAVYLMGHSGNKRHAADWYPCVDDGRQRRDAALELSRRLNWCAEVLAGAVAEVRDSKPGMRNLLVKLGKGVRERFPLDKDGVVWPTQAAQDGDAAERAALVAAAWRAVVAEHVAQLPAAPSYYDEWCMEGEPQAPRLIAGEQPLYWLDENFAKLFVGDGGALGDHSKGGWVLREKADEAGGAHYQIRGVPLVHLTCRVVGENPDLTDPKPLLDSICSKTVSVKMAPSQIARNVARVLAARKNPRDPASGALYSPETVRQNMGISKSTMDDYSVMVGEYEPDVQRPDGSFEPGARHGGMCDEVLELIDRGAMSMAFALTERDSAFVTWPKKGARTALPYDKQRLVLAHLYARIPPGADGEVRFSGDAARTVATQLRNAAMLGKLGPVGDDGDETDDDKTAQKPTGGAGKDGAGEGGKEGGAGDGTGDGASGAGKVGQDGSGSGATGPEKDKKPGKAPSFDAESFRARVASVAASAPAAERAYTASSVARLVEAVVLHVRGGAALDLAGLPEEHAAVLRAILAPSAAQAPAVPESTLLGEWVAVALDGAVAACADFRPGAVTTETTAANGAKPTQEQADKANALIRTWLDEYTDADADLEAKTFEDYVMAKINSIAA